MFGISGMKLGILKSLVAQASISQIPGLPVFTSEVLGL